MDVKNEIIKINRTDDFVSDIKNIISQARQATCRAINSAMVISYWLVGKRIVEEEQNGKDRADYGSYILQKLSKSLSEEFGEGFSYANLRNMRQFYRTYPNEQICYTMCSKSDWSHNRLIMRVSDPKARMFYLQESAKENWSVKQLERNIQTCYYQRMLSSQPDNLDENFESAINVKDFVKDPYVLEFVGLPPYPNHKEKPLENALIDCMQEFLLELGKGFSFVARQMRISTETSHFYIDLVFYNYILKCFVLIDLKTSKLTHQDVGQMDMYVRMFDDLKRGEEDNPTIGILMCAEKEETVVKYSILNGSQQLFATKYLPYMPTEEELYHVLERNMPLALNNDIESNNI